jgi:hypothetical protein
MIIICAFVLTSAIMFWFPFFKADPGLYGGGFVDQDSGYGIGDCCQQAEEKLKIRASVAERLKLEQVFSELRTLDDATLTMMKSFDELCTNGLVNCRELDSAKIKPLIEAVLLDRQIARDAYNSQSARNANYFSASSLFVAFIALLFSGLTYFTRKPKNR